MSDTPGGRDLGSVIVAGWGRVGWVDDAAGTGRLPGDFWRLWSASVVSRLGGGVVSSAAPLLAATLTRDPRQIALVSVAAGLPWLLFALHTGALADRWDRRRTMVGCDLASAAIFLALTGLVLVDRAGLAALCAVAFAAATVGTLFDSAGQAALPSVVGKALLGTANSRLYTGTVMTGFFLGPPLGSWLFTASPAVPFAVDAVSFVGSALLVASIRVRFSTPPREPSSVRQDIAEGVRWLWAHRELRALVTLLTLWNLTETAYVAVLVLYGLEQLSLAPSAYGILLSGLAAGGLLGAAAAPRLERRWGTGTVIAGTVVASVLAVVGLAVTRQPVVAVVLLALLGVAAFAFNVVSVTYRQSVVPDHLQGRVSSTYRFATWGVGPVGAALGGLLAAAWGLPALFLVAAGVQAAGAVLTLPRLTNTRLSASLSTPAAPPDDHGPGGATRRAGPHPAP